MPKVKIKQTFVAKVGSVAVSTAGRDKDNTYMIYSFIDANYVYLVDGRTKKTANPKKKKLKHLKLTGDELTAIAKKIIANKIVHDAEIVSALRKLGGNQSEG